MFTYLLLTFYLPSLANYLRVNDSIDFTYFEKFKIIVSSWKILIDSHLKDGFS